MCLYIDDPKVLVAKEDITIYKVALVKDNNYRSPVYNAIIKLNKLYKSELEVDVKRKVVNEALHAYTSIAMANISYGHYAKSAVVNNAVVLIRSKIPKGSKYYLGNVYSYGEIAADAIIYEEVIK